MRDTLSPAAAPAVASTMNVSTAFAAIEESANVGGVAAVVMLVSALVGVLAAILPARRAANLDVLTAIATE